MLSRRLLQGFTLIELLITIAVMVILIAIGVPSFNALVTNARIKTTGQSIVDGLQLARAEAIRRNERVYFAMGSGSNWSVITDAGVSLQARSSGEGSGSITVTTTPTNSTRVTFNALGRAVTNADASARVTTFNIDAPTSLLAASLSKELRVTVSDGGSIRMCDPNVTTTGDPRKC